MSDHKYPAYQPTGSETLEKLVMDPNIPKSETEGWACREIERLRASNESLINLVEEMQQESRRSFLLPTAMMAFSVILLIVVSFM